MPTKLPNIVHNTMQLSITAQAVSIAIAIYALAKTQLNENENENENENKNKPLKTMVAIELTASLIQSATYGSVLRQSDIQSMALRRYYDWVFTTPIMLFTNIAYMEYIARGRPSDFSVQTFADENKSFIAIITIANFLMLLFGILGEAGTLPMIPALVLGFAAFFVTFWIIWTRFAHRSHEGKVLFAFFFVVWATYGVAFVLPDVSKNVLLNCIDILAKNMFLVFLSWNLLDERNKA